jgi:uncharacterized protein
MTKEFKTFAATLDGAKEGSFAGWASTYGGEPDSYGDVVMPGAFSKTVAANGGRIKVLSQHDPTNVIGIGTLTDKAHGLWIEGQLVLDLPSAREAYVRLKAGLIDRMSIGYETITSRAKNGVRQLTEIKLWEVSLVTFPANQHAAIESVKAEEEWEDVAAHMRRLNVKLREELTAAKLRDALHTLRRVNQRLRS